MTDNKVAEERKNKPRAIKIVFFVVLVFVVSGVGSVITEKFMFPWLATHKWFEDQAFFKQAMENVTIINKTEQTTVNESRDVSEYTEKSASSVVEIVSRQKGNKNAVFSAGEQSASGIIVTADGLVASYGGKFFGGKDTEYKVFMQDGKSFNAEVVATDFFSNIVLLRLESAENLPVAEFVAAEDIKTGMKIAVVGRSGFNVETSLKLGITSEVAKSYSISGPLASSEKLQGVLFADLGFDNEWDESLAGGATVDQNGNIVGILGERKEDAVSRFFIVPVDYLQDAVGQYLAKGKIERATLGVYYVALSRETAYLAENNFERGALVYSPSGQQGLAVIAGSPAEKSDIKIGDIILGVNGEEVNPDHNLANFISKYKSGDSVTLKIMRDGNEMEVKVVLE